MAGKSLSSNRYAQFLAQANVIQELASFRVDELVGALKVQLYRNSKMYIGCCPIHGGDRRDALRLYHDGHSIRGNWVCYTRHCEATFHKTLLGFVRGVLSNQECGWAKAGDKMVSFMDTVEFVRKFLGIKYSDIQTSQEEIEKKRFAARMRMLLKSPQAVTSVALPRKTVRSHLHIPAEYFQKRGYQKEVLDAFDVGFYPYKNRPLSNRVVAPIYDDDYRFAVGFTGRSIFDKCPKCGLFHDQHEECPVTAIQKANAAKWRNHPKEFNAHSFLYGYWASKQYIRDTETIVLVEGAGEFWRLWEAGIYNACALLGSRLCDEQQIIVEKSGALNVVLLLNSDNSGKHGRDDAVKRLSRSYRVKTIELPKKDLGEMKVEEVKELLHK